jgi:hypothetical protein
VERDTAQRNDNMRIVPQAKSEVSLALKVRVAKPRRITRTVEIEMGRMAATTVAGFRQVFGCDPEYISETYRDGECITAECTGNVA